MANTGIKTVLTLRKYVDGVATSETKVNVPGDPDYIAPYEDLVDCPTGESTTTQSTTATTGTTATTDSTTATTETTGTTESTTATTETTGTTESTTATTGTTESTTATTGTTESTTATTETTQATCNCVTVDVLNTQLTSGGLDLYYIYNSCESGEASVNLNTYPSTEQDGSTYFAFCQTGSTSNMYKYGASGDPFVGLEGMNTVPNGTTCTVDGNCSPVVPTTTITTESTTATTETTDIQCYEYQASVPTQSGESLEITYIDCDGVEQDILYYWNSGVSSVTFCARSIVGANYPVTGPGAQCGGNEPLPTTQATTAATTLNPTCHEVTYDSSVFNLDQDKYGIGYVNYLGVFTTETFNEMLSSPNGSELIYYVCANSVSNDVWDVTSNPPVAVPQYNSSLVSNDSGTACDGFCSPPSGGGQI